MKRTAEPLANAGDQESEYSVARNQVALYDLSRINNFPMSPKVTEPYRLCMSIRGVGLGIPPDTAGVNNREDGIEEFGIPNWQDKRVMLPL